MTSIVAWRRSACLAIATLALLLSHLARAASSQLTRNECLDLGFHSDLVVCGDCDVLLEHANDAELHRECLHCCAEEDKATAAATEKYVHARLELDFRLVTPGSEWKKFFQDVLPTLPRVAPYDTPRMGAKLVMETAEGEKHVVRIATWSTDLVRDYLRNKLAV